MPGSITRGVAFPSLNLANASIPTVPLSQWYPAGAAMNTLKVNIFNGQISEGSALCSGAIDLTDFPIPASGSTGCGVSSPAIGSNEYFEIQFDLSNNFWGCSFDFGNSLCGVDIRQGISHLVDKTSFAQTDPSLLGQALALDNPVPASNGLATPIACLWDSLSPETNATTGNRCVVGNPPMTGGVAYNQAPGSPTGLCGTESSPSTCPYPWMRGFGSPDFCAAADHLIHAGLATGKDANCVLTGVNTASVTGKPVDFFIRSDSLPRFRLGTGMAETICALFTGSYTIGCTTTSGPSGSCLQSGTTSFPSGSILCVFNGTIAAFPGFTTCHSTASTCTPINNWWIYTGGFFGANPFDSTLYGTYNSLFVSAPGPPCASTITTSTAPNYMYLCVPAYDTYSNQMEFAPCLSAPGDPSAGQSNPTFATCPGSTRLTGVSAAYKAEDTFGHGAYTIPIYSPSIQFAYLSNWSRVIDAQGVGIPNYFTWLDAQSSTPAVAGTIRQGFYTSTYSLNPYTASTAHDFYLLNNIYDTLYQQNPLSPNQLIDWMTTRTSTLNNTQLGYTPPAGTTISIRNVLRPGMFWHDGQQVTAWDVKFSLLTLTMFCPPFCISGTSPIAGVTVLNGFQFDINLNFMALFTKMFVGSISIIPGRHWSVCGEATWDADVAAGNVPNSCMSTTNPAIQATFDPLAAGILIGSGPWVCENTGANTSVPVGTVGTGCSSSNTQSPGAGGTFTLTRYGCTITTGGTACLPPASSPSGHYFRSSGDLALWIWSGMTGSSTSDFLTISLVAFCYNRPIGTTGCTHYQSGIGASSSGVVGFIQVSAIASFFGVGWTTPYSWSSLAGIDSFPPVLYEGSFTLNPCSIDPVNGYDC